MTNQSGLLDILTIIAPIFIVVGTGYLAVLKNIIARDGVRFLASFVVNFAVPALLFKSISERNIDEVLHPDFLLVYGLGSFATFIILLFAARKLLAENLTASSMYGLGGSLSNSLMIGYPIASGLLGQAAVVPFALALLVENFLIMPLSLALADIGRNRGKGFFNILQGVFPTILKNPIILAILTGLLFSLFKINMPAFALNVVDLFSRTVAGVGLFVIGGMLVGFKYRGRVREVSLIAFGKLFLHPLMVLVLFLFFPAMDAQLKTAGVILASVPMFGIFAVIGQRYGMGDICAAAQVPATVISFISITGFVWLLQVSSIFS